jgi:hypothetical protein
LCLCFDFLDEHPEVAEVLIDYTDLNGRPYSTRIQLDEINVASALRVSRFPATVSESPWKPWTWEPVSRREWLKSKVRKSKKDEA